MSEYALRPVGPEMLEKMASYGRLPPGWSRDDPRFGRLHDAVANQEAMVFMATEDDRPVGGAVCRTLTDDFGDRVLHVWMATKFEGEKVEAKKFWGCLVALAQLIGCDKISCESERPWAKLIKPLLPESIIYVARV